MDELQFTARIWKQGESSNVVTIPIQFIKAGYLEKGDIITFKIMKGLRNPGRK